MRRGLGLLAVIALAAGAGILIGRPGGSTVVRALPAAAAASPTVPPTTTTTAPPAPSTIPGLGGPFLTVAPNGSSLDVFDAPNGALLTKLKNPLYTVPLVLLVKSLPPEADWLHVHLPIRPNQASGYVRRADVKVAEIKTQILIEQQFKRLTAWNDGKLVLEAPVAVGKPSTPTPNGVYFMQGIAKIGNPRGAYGPYILVLSAHSDVYKTFAGGDGLVGIHGTNAPGLIGKAVSNGCIRMTNEKVTELAKLVQPGSPVVIVS